MHEMIENLYELCETLEDELNKTNEKIRKAGGELSGSDLEYIDKLTHSIKSIKCVIAMAEDEGEDGYSERGGMGGTGGMSYARDGRGGNRGGNRGGSSYARGRRNARRDSMGRYSREGGYSYAEDGMKDMIEEMRNMMTDLPAEKQREVRQFIDKMERM